MDGIDSMAVCFWPFQSRMNGRDFSISLKSGTCTDAKEERNNNCNLSETDVEEQKVEQAKKENLTKSELQQCQGQQVLDATPDSDNEIECADVKKNDKQNIANCKREKILSFITHECELSKRKLSDSAGAEEIDPSYWEKRRKNNESAKRSREARRMKEEATRYTADLLLVEHESLQKEKADLEEEIRQLRHALATYN
ncbi:uncharacterized protein [Watersipora subatra]|uniref:uncharacterized protein n=1 Tax=Watersipora subatra TaxID=2589382 RepID=UPI00355C23FE